jgi:hypothetical protein
MNANVPALASRDIDLSVTDSPVASVEFNYVSGAGHDAVFAVSGQAVDGDSYYPIAVAGFNADMIVEASAAHREAFSSATTASIERGVLNVGRTFYEQGYYALTPSSGLPAAGSVVVDASAADHEFALAGSYQGNNAAMIDGDNPGAILVPASPAACSVLSFLCTAGNGPVTATAVVEHENGVAESKGLTLPDWLDADVTSALAAGGRVSLDNRIVDLAGTALPGCSRWTWRWMTRQAR